MLTRIPGSDDDNCHIITAVYNFSCLHFVSESLFYNRHPDPEEDWRKLCID